MKYVFTGFSFLLSLACAPTKLPPPVGFVEVQNDPHHIRMKSQDRLGLSIRVFDNYKGGTLAFWSEDLVRKLGMRGYQLMQQSAVKSKNRVIGTQFDFAYQQDSTEKFYTAVLFVTDKYLVVLQLAGDVEQRERVRQQLPKILSDFKVHGCHLGSKVCKGPQPIQLKTPTPSQRSPVQP